MSRPRNGYWMVAVMLAGALLAGPARAAVSPHSRFNHPPPPHKPRPLVVRPPTPPRPGDHMPNDAPPTLQETPEPGSMVTALIGGGLSLMAAWRRRRKVPEPEVEP